VAAANGPVPGSGGTSRQVPPCNATAHAGDSGSVGRLLGHSGRPGGERARRGLAGVPAKALPLRPPDRGAALWEGARRQRGGRSAGAQCADDLHGFDAHPHQPAGMYRGPTESWSA
jgi:hypothetical protein